MPNQELSQRVFIESAVSSGTATGSVTGLSRCSQYMEVSPSFALPENLANAKPPWTGAGIC